MDLSILAVVFSLGLRHGLDADHLAAIDGLSRLRPNRWNGVLFALGHGGIVTVLAVGFQAILGNFNLDWLSPYLFLGIGLLNLWRLLRPQAHIHSSLMRGIQFGPLMLGILLAIGFESSSQIAALALSSQVAPLWLGLAFTGGMVISDGVDGFLASRIQYSTQSAQAGSRANLASTIMGWIVVVVSIGYATLGLAKIDIISISWLLGLGLFTILIALRLWSAGTDSTPPKVNSGA